MIINQLPEKNTLFYHKHGGGKTGRSVWRPLWVDPCQGIYTFKVFKKWNWVVSAAADSQPSCELSLDEGVSNAAGGSKL